MKSAISDEFSPADISLIQALDNENLSIQAEEIILRASRKSLDRIGRYIFWKYHCQREKEAIKNLCKEIKHWENEELRKFVKLFN